MTRRNFIKALAFLWSILFFKEESDAENNNENLQEAMFWRRIEDE